MITVYLWVIGIIKGGSTITFVVWQLGLVSVMTCASLQVASAWLLFAAAAIYFRGNADLASTLAGLSAVPWAAALFIGVLIGREGLSSILGATAIVGSIALGIAIVLAWSAVHDAKCSHPLKTEPT